MRAEFDKILFEVSIQTSVTVRTGVLRRHIKNLSISEPAAAVVLKIGRNSNVKSIKNIGATKSSARHSYSSQRT